MHLIQSWLVLRDLDFLSSLSIILTFCRIFTLQKFSKFLWGSTFRYRMVFEKINFSLHYWPNSETSLMHLCWDLDGSSKIQLNFLNQGLLTAPKNFGIFKLVSLECHLEWLFNPNHLISQFSFKVLFLSLFLLKKFHISICPRGKTPKFHFF